MALFCQMLLQQKQKNYTGLPDLHKHLKKNSYQTHPVRLLHEGIASISEGAKTASLVKLKYLIWVDNLI